jgi:hypothetical protein
MESEMKWDGPIALPVNASVQADTTIVRSGQLGAIQGSVVSLDYEPPFYTSDDVVAAVPFLNQLEGMDPYFYTSYPTFFDHDYFFLTMTDATVRLRPNKFLRMYAIFNGPSADPGTSPVIRPVFSFVLIRVDASQYHAQDEYPLEVSIEGQLDYGYPELFIEVVRNTTVLLPRGRLSHVILPLGYAYGDLFIPARLRPYGKVSSGELRVTATYDANVPVSVSVCTTGSIKLHNALEAGGLQTLYPFEVLPNVEPIPFGVVIVPT